MTEQFNAYIQQMKEAADLVQEDEEQRSELDQAFSRVDQAVQRLRSRSAAPA